MRSLNVIDLDVLPYEDTYFIQKQILAKKKPRPCEDYMLLVEHPAVLTIGRSGTKKNLLVDEVFLSKNDLKIVEIDRGGDITFHGIGQVVVYPIFDLRNHIKDVRLFIKNLEYALELSVSEYGLTADKEKKYSGLWVRGDKIGFIGIAISNWITYHGVSINANVNLEYFSTIRPCGIDNLRISSLQKILNKDVDLKLLKAIIVKKFCEVFGFDRSYRCPQDAALAKKEGI